MENQCNGFVFLDFLFSTIPIILMLLTALQLSSSLTSSSEANIKDQILLNKLISVSDYVVRYGAVEKNNGYYSPNEISESEFNSLNIIELKEKLNLHNLHVSFAQGEGNCIYRLVIYKNQIKKLYFCG